MVRNATLRGLQSSQRLSAVGVHCGGMHKNRHNSHMENLCGGAWGFLHQPRGFREFLGYGNVIILILVLFGIDMLVT